MERDPLGVEGAVEGSVVAPKPIPQEKKALEPILEGETVIQSVSGRKFNLAGLKQTNVVLYLRFNLSDSRAAQE